MPTLLYMIDFGGQIGFSIEKASFLATVHGLGQVGGAWTPFFGVGAMAAHWVTGWMRDTIGTYHFAFAIAATMSFFAMMTIRFVRKTGH